MFNAHSEQYLFQGWSARKNEPTWFSWFLQNCYLEIRYAILLLTNLNCTVSILMLKLYSSTKWVKIKYLRPVKNAPPFLHQGLPSTCRYYVRFQEYCCSETSRAFYSSSFHLSEVSKEEHFAFLIHPARLRLYLVFEYVIFKFGLIFGLLLIFTISPTSTKGLNFSIFTVLCAGSWFYFFPYLA